MRFLTKIITLFVILVITIFCSANSQTVKIRFLPEEINSGFSSLEIPVFFLILFFTAVGIVLGSLSQYLRSIKARRIAKKNLRKIDSLHNEVNYLRAKSKSEADEILSLIK